MLKKHLYSILSIFIFFNVYSQQEINFNPKVYINGSVQNMIQPDSSTIRVCKGDSIKIVMAPSYPNSFESTGNGYSQNDNNVSRKWYLPNNIIVEDVFETNFVVNSNDGFSVVLLLTDASNFQYIKNLLFYVGVRPNFNQLLITPNPVCPNDVITLHGGVNSADSTFNGMSVDQGTVTASDILSDTTFLPDGSGDSYESIINILSFNSGQLVSNSCGLESICLNMEHSYLGDLNIQLICPNGQIATLLAFASGDNTGGEYLGTPIIGSSNAPGTGVDYCFSMSATQTMEQVAGTINSGQMMPSMTYLPVSNFSDLNGCPLNGTWTIRVTDSLLTDNGYIFNWGINFDACQYTGNMTYQNKPVSGGWINVDDISFQSNDSIVTIADTNQFSFEVIDNFGCQYDTTLTITVLENVVNLVADKDICNATYAFSGNTGGSGIGIWSVMDNPTPTPTFSNNSLNPTVTLPQFGAYTLIYTESTCQEKDTVVVTWHDKPSLNLAPPLFTCPGTKLHLEVKDSVNMDNITWGITPMALDTLFSVNLNPGPYNVHLVSKFGCVKDSTINIGTQSLPEINYPKHLFCDDNDPNIVDTIFIESATGPDFGNWACNNCPAGITYKDQDSLNTQIYLTKYGSYEFIFTESVCQDKDTLVYKFSPSPYAESFDQAICRGFSTDITANVYEPSFISDMEWKDSLGNSLGDGDKITVSNAGTYYLILTNDCPNPYVMDVVVTVKECDIQVPNVFSPNGDGTNDIFKLLTADLSFFEKFSVVITDRWGTIVFQSDKPDFEWNGKDAIDGVYFYNIRSTTIEKEELNKQGFVQVFGVK